MYVRRNQCPLCGLLGAERSTDMLTSRILKHKRVRGGRAAPLRASGVTMRQCWT